MLKFAMALVAATLFVTPCFAQTSDAAAAQTAQSSDVDPARLAAARRVVASNGSSASFRFYVDQMVPLFMAPIARAHGLNEAQTQVATRLVSEEMLASTDELVELIARVYAIHFPTEDLNALADFYESPLGQRLVTAMPEVMADSGRVSQVFAEQVMAPRMQARIRALEADGRLNP
ncbi:DUF2059 domain-containing protein [Terricaulis sp.]|uniref:DUF2059 domain-containing protein n=1 Tax=Terricaulis sp. TaxID=2768686 RepID=UPI003783C3E3